MPVTLHAERTPGAAHARPACTGYLGLLNIDGSPLAESLRASATRALGDGAVAADSSGTSHACCAAIVRPGLHGPTFAAGHPGAPPELGDAWAICDGRIDNRGALAALRARMRPGIWDCSAADIVLAAYLRWGTDCAEHLIGDFAFAVWDPQQRHLFCARDPMQLRPFYYSQTGSLFRWGGDPQRVLGDAAEEYDIEYLRMFALRQHINWGRSPFARVAQLPGGYSMTVGAGGRQVRRWWQLPEPGSLRYRSRPEYREHFRGLLGYAVAARMAGADHVAVALSGGIDSSAVTATAQRLRAEGRVPASRLTAVTFAPGDVPGSNEFGFAARIAERLEVPHVEAGVSGDSYLRDIETVAGRFPEPNLLAGFWDVWSAIRESCRSRGATVLLTGTAGDELWAGNLYFLAVLARQSRYWSLFQALRRLRAAGLKWRDLIRKGLVDGAVQTRDGYAIPVNPSRFPWVREPFLPLPEAPGRSDHPAHSAFCETFLQRRFSIGEISPVLFEPTGIEVRHPYLDRRLVEFVYSIPLEVRLSPHQDKPLLRETFADTLPRSLTHNSIMAEPYMSRGIYGRWDAIAQSIHGDLGVLEQVVHPETLRKEAAALRLCRWDLLPILTLGFWLQGRGQAPIPRPTGTMDPRSE